MKIKTLVAVLLLSGGVTSTFAQTENCNSNSSISHEAVRAGNFKDAYAPCMAVLKDCPTLRYYTFTDAQKILVGFLSQIKDRNSADYKKYFDELMDRIRDIRSSEKVFWRKVLDIYATSVDYDPRTEASVLFFKTVQNKMHWAAHGQTAAEKIFYSADSSKPNMGLRSFSGSHPTQSDALVAKNYCTEDELLALNDIVSAYLDLAEMQARRRIPMYMSDWIDTLDGFLKLSKHEILTHAGKISAAAAEKKAKEEYRKYKELQSAELSRGEKDYIAALESAEQKLLKKSDQ